MLSESVRLCPGYYGGGGSARAGVEWWTRWDGGYWLRVVVVLAGARDGLVGRQHGGAATRVVSVASGNLASVAASVSHRLPGRSS